MKNKLYGIVVFILVIAILAVSIKSMKIIQAKREAIAKAKAGERDLAVPVQTSIVKCARIDNIITFNGDIEPMERVEIKSRISGRLLKLELEDGTPVEVGTFVKKGEQIAQLDDRELDAELAAAKAKLASAKAELVNYEACRDSAQTMLKDRERELNRQKLLREKDSTSQQSLDFAQTDYDKAVAFLTQSNAAIQRGDAGIMQAEADVRAAEVNISETRIYAPLTGVISERRLDPGAMVSGETTIVTILDVAYVKVILSVPINHLPKLVPGKTKARMTTTSLQGEYIECQIAKIYPAVDLSTRTARIEMRIKNERTETGRSKLLPGMYATVEVLVESRPNVIVVDASVPIRNQDKYLIFVADGDTVAAVPVVLGTRNKEQVEIVSGLSEGQEIVVVGQHRLTDGAAIHRLEGNNVAM